jgi:GT2 family glycosyltransferase
VLLDLEVVQRLSSKSPFISTSECRSALRTVMPQVSIVIPVYNQPVLILEAVASLKAQSVTDWEAILVDDGSTDETPNVLQALASQDARLVLSWQSRRGAAAARNTGAAKAQADWLLFLDSDDWLSPGALGSLWRGALQDVELVHALGLRVCGSRSQDRSQVRLPGGDLFHRLASTATFMVHACLVRKSTFHELGGFDDTMMGCADWDLWQRVVRSGARCVGIDEIVAFYRQTESSLSTLHEQELRDGLIVIARGHGRDPRVPRPDPRYAEGISPREFPAAAYRFASWLAGRAIARGNSPLGILNGIQVLPAEPLSASDIGAALFDAIPIGLGDFGPKWKIYWPSLQPQLQEFLEKLATSARCGPPFAGNVLRQIETLAATANASDTMCVIGGTASRVIRIPGSVANLSFTPGITSFIAVVRSDRADVGVLEIPVDNEKVSGKTTREMVVQFYLRAILSAYFRNFPLSMLYGALKYAALAWRSPMRSSLKKKIFHAVLAQDFILPIVEESSLRVCPETSGRIAEFPEHEAD